MVIDRRVPFLAQLLRSEFIIDGLFAMNCGDEKMKIVLEVFIGRLVRNAMIFLFTPALVAISSKLMAMIDPYLSLPD